MTSASTPEVSLTEVTWNPDAADHAFYEPYVDVDEWRDFPVHHRYVHGGFSDGDTKFSVYLPAAENFQGRFFQHVTPVPQSENLAQSETRDDNPVPFSIASGAYFVETNGGGPSAANRSSGVDPSIGAYRANAAVARFSRQIAERVFGPQRIYGYLYGGSGGGYRTIGASENTRDVWDGFVPYVIGSPMAIPNVFTVRMHAQRVLRDRFPEIVDAYDVGGDPTALVLTDDEADALAEVTRMGFPIRSWFGWQTMGMHAFSVIYPGVLGADPSYVDDFWDKDGYLGSVPGASVHRDRIRLTTRIDAVLTDANSQNEDRGGVDTAFKATIGNESTIVGAQLADAPSGWALGAELIVRTGGAAGNTIRLVEVTGNRVVFEPGQNLDGLANGDEVLLDNSNFLATQTYHRHQVPQEGYPVWDQFRDEEGAPKYPQRQMLLGPMFAAGASGTQQTGRISGKMIVVASLLDREAFPWQADWYRRQVAAFLDDSTDDRFRLWYTDNALHGDESAVQEHETRTVSYVGALQAALRQLSAWVEHGTLPADNTSYDVVDGQVLISSTDPHRGGVQPIVTLTVNGAVSTTVRSGEPVNVKISAVAMGAGAIVQVATDLTGEAAFSSDIEVEPVATVMLERTCRFEKPGTYFIAARVTAHAGAGAGEDHYARVHNISRARVTVTG